MTEPATDTELNEIEDAIRLADSAASKQDWVMAQALLAPHIKALQDYSHGCYLAGVLLIQAKQIEQGINWLRLCLQQDPNHVDALYALGHQLLARREYFQAAQCFQKVTQLRPDIALAWFNLGLSLIQADLPEESLKAYQKAHSLKFDLPKIDMHLARALIACGERDQAKLHINKALMMTPDDIYIVWQYVTIHQADVSDRMLEQFEAMVEQKLFEGKPCSEAAFAIAQIYEKRGDLESACDYYDKANAERHKLEPYEIEKRREMFAQVRELTADWGTKDFSDYGVKEKGPVFIVGMARSGTTLMHQLLAAHSQITGAGELRFMKVMAYDRAPEIIGKPFPELMSHITPEKSKELASLYLDNWRRYGDTPFIIDKMPTNLFYVPLIKMLMPEAIVIHMQRDPIDTCWSLWRQNFEPGHGYSYDMELIAKNYADTQKHMDFYKSLFPGFVQEVTYESLVADAESEVRRLIDLCGLEWEDSVMDYHKQKQKIRTASVNQASRAVYKTSQRSWEPVKHRIRPLIEALHQEGIETCVSRGEVEL